MLRLHFPGTQIGTPSGIYLIFGSVLVVAALCRGGAFRRLFRRGTSRKVLPGIADLHVVGWTVSPNDVTPTFLIQHGRSSVDWSAVASVQASPFPGSSGLSEAVLYQVQLNRKPSAEADCATPRTCVLKHYDTSICRTPTVGFRALRCLMALTSERMAVCELYFYLHVRPFLIKACPDQHNAPMYVASLFFAAHKDLGEPSLCWYLCGHGSGSTATLGLEDLAQAGFTFTHTKEPGLKDDRAVRAALRALAFFHGACWNRIANPAAIQGDVAGEKLVAPPIATIPQFAHRCGSKLGAWLHKNYDLQAFAPSIDKLFATWADSTIFQHPDIQRTLRRIYKDWASIRQDAVRIITTQQTFVHGDYNHRNIGFRTQKGGLAVPSQETPQVCAFDFQACGAGSAAHEVLYFLASSVPVALDCGDDQPTVPPSIPHAKRLSLSELRTMDRAFVQDYHGHLPACVKDVYPLQTLQDEFDALALHWAGCSLFVTKEQAEKIKMSTDPTTKAFVESADATSSRFILSAAAIGFERQY